MPIISWKIGHSEEFFLYMPKPSSKMHMNRMKKPRIGHSEEIFPYMPKSSSKCTWIIWKNQELGMAKKFFCICSCESARKKMQKWKKCRNAKNAEMKKMQKCKKIPKRNLTIEKFCSIILILMHAEVPNDETCIEENRPQRGL